MPYINEEMQERETSPGIDEDFADQVTGLIDGIKREFPLEEREGAVNYAISRIVAGSLRPEERWRYAALNHALGTFFSAGLEFYRRLVGPYEDLCIAKNGDIPEYEEGTEFQRQLMELLREKGKKS